MDGLFDFPASPTVPRGPFIRVRNQTFVTAADPRSPCSPDSRFLFTGTNMWDLMDVARRATPWRLSPTLQRGTSTSSDVLSRALHLCLGEPECFRRSPLNQLSVCACVGVPV